MFGPFRKKPPADATLPAAEQEPERYAGRPLLIVLENYVLDCIGELPPDKQALVRSVVQHTLGGGDDWRATVRQQLQLEQGMDEALRGMWSRNQEIARQHHQQLHPVQFAKMVLDQELRTLDRLTELNCGGSHRGTEGTEANSNCRAATRNSTLKSAPSGDTGVPPVLKSRAFGP